MQGLFDFPSSKIGLYYENRVSFLLATGYKKIAFIETGKENEEGDFVAFQENFNMNVMESKNGSIDVSLPHYSDVPSAIIMSGGYLKV